MTTLYHGSNEIIFKTFNSQKSEFYAENQTLLYNIATKNLPGPNSQNATKESILARIEMPFFDPAGIIYAIEKSTGQFIAYCQSIQVTQSIIRIGYPWSLPNVSDDIKTRLLDKLFAYYKQKYPEKELEFEIYTIDNRWQREITWLEQKAFKLLCYWFWPIMDISAIEFTDIDFGYDTIEAQPSDFQLIKSLFNENDDIKRFRSTDQELQKVRFKTLIESTKFHVFLKVNNIIVAFIAVVCSENKDDPISLTSLLIDKCDSEIIFAKKILSLALNFGTKNGYNKFSAWFSDNSIFYQCLKPYLTNEVKWYHGSLIK